MLIAASGPEKRNNTRFIPCLDSSAVSQEARYNQRLRSPLNPSQGLLEIGPCSVQLLFLVCFLASPWSPPIDCSKAQPVNTDRQKGNILFPPRSFSEAPSGWAGTGGSGAKLNSKASSGQLTQAYIWLEVLLATE